MSHSIEGFKFVKSQLATPIDKLAADERHCYICYNQIEKKEKETGIIEYAIRLEPCGHVFGHVCLETWVCQPQGTIGSNTCPLCRRVLFKRKREVPLPAVMEEGGRQGAEVQVQPSEDIRMELEATGRTRPNTVQEGPPAEIIDPLRIESMRRWGATSDVWLYDRMKELGQRAGISDRVPPRQQRQATFLSAEEDFHLFQLLEAQGAFGVAGMDSELVSMNFGGGSQQYQRTSNAEMYIPLRDQGARWDPDRQAWFRFGWRVVFNGVDAARSEEEHYFDYLRKQGALCTDVVESLFRIPRSALASPESNGSGTPVARTDWQVYQQILKVWVDPVAWNAEVRAWLTSDGRDVFGNMARSLGRT